MDCSRDSEMAHGGAVALQASPPGSFLFLCLPSAGRRRARFNPAAGTAAGRNDNDNYLEGLRAAWPGMRNAKFGAIGLPRWGNWASVDLRASTWVREDGLATPLPRLPSSSAGRKRRRHQGPPVSFRRPLLDRSGVRCLNQGLLSRGNNQPIILWYRSLLHGIRSTAFFAKIAACSSVCRFSLGSAIHSRMIARRASCSGLMLGMARAS